MYNYDGKYSILDAPAHLTSFLLESNGKIVDSLTVPENGKLNFNLKIYVYLPNHVQGEFEGIYLSIYSTGLKNDIYLSQQVADVTEIAMNPVGLVFPVEIDANLLIDIHAINIQLALSSKHDGEMGVGESLLLGRFLNTLIPLKEVQHD